MPDLLFFTPWVPGDPRDERKASPHNFLGGRNVVLYSCFQLLFHKSLLDATLSGCELIETWGIDRGTGGGQLFCRMAQ